MYTITKTQIEQLRRLANKYYHAEDYKTVIDILQSLLEQGEAQPVELTELLAQYWDIAYQEGKLGKSNGTVAGQVLHSTLQLFTHPPASKLVTADDVTDEMVDTYMAEIDRHKLIDVKIDLAAAVNAYNGLTLEASK